MDTFDEKYNIITNEAIKAYHKTRRMFCVKEDEVFIADANLPYSHAVWFEQKGWMSREEDSLMNEIVRGIADRNKDISFYIGYDFQVNEEIEDIFFPHLKELARRLNLNPDSRVFGGWIKPKTGNIWLPRKEYGTIKNPILTSHPQHNNA